MTLQDAARLTSALAVHVRPVGKTPIEVPGSWVIIGSPWRVGHVRVRTQAAPPGWPAGRDHRLLAVARIGREVLPFLPLLRDADAQVTRLVEMHADDAGKRASGPWPLATALVALATTASPAPALAAAATDTVQRIHRLLNPAQPLGHARRHLLRATAAALALTPVLLALAPAVLALALGRVPAA